MICFLVQRLIHAYLGDALPPKDADRLRHHCQECTACGTALREAQAAARLVSLLPRWSLPEGEGEALLGRVRARGQARLGEQILGTGCRWPCRAAARRARWRAMGCPEARRGAGRFPLLQPARGASCLRGGAGRRRAPGPAAPGCPHPADSTQLGQVVEAPPVAGGELAPPPTSDHRGPIRPPAHRDAARPMAAPNIASAPVPSRAPDRPPAAGSTVAPRPRTARPAQRPAQRAACGEQPASTPPVTVIQMPAAKRGQRLPYPPRTAADSGAPRMLVGRAARRSRRGSAHGRHPLEDNAVRAEGHSANGGAPPGVAEGALRAAPNEETMAAQPLNALQETMGARHHASQRRGRAAPPSAAPRRHRHRSSTDPAGPTAKRRHSGRRAPPRR